MKKALAIIISLAFTVGLSACSRETPVSNKHYDTSQESNGSQLADSRVQSMIRNVTESPETSGICGANLTWYYQNGVLYITGTGEMTDYAETSAPWYDDLGEKIDLIIIDEGVTNFGEGAFCGFDNLREITIPGSVTSIGDYAFSGCSSLTEITIPNSVTSIGAYAFWGCSSLTEITIPDSVTSIGHIAFCDCSSLAEITISNSVTSIGALAFLGCISLTEIIIPDSVTSIGNEAFSGCSSLTEITIPDSVTGIGDHAFIDCGNLTIHYSGNDYTVDAFMEYFRNRYPDLS